MLYDKLYKAGNKLDVLFVEDDKDFLETSVEIFSNIFHSTTIARDGEEGLAEYLKYFHTKNKYFDIVISDFHMPKMNGINLSKALYEINKNQVIVIISAFNQPDNLIDFINLGIDKFLLKPFEMQNMVDVLYDAALHVQTENTDEDNSSFISFSKDIVWDKKNELLLKNNDVLHLPNKEYVFLKLLIKNHPSITSYDEIFYTLWEEEYDVSNLNTLKSIISRLRNKLPNGTIKNISKVGYLLQY